MTQDSLSISGAAPVLLRVRAGATRNMSRHVAKTLRPWLFGSGEPETKSILPVVPVTLTLPPLTGKRVVIVEDEGMMQMLLRQTLTARKLTVVGSALNGAEGVSMVLQEKPDIVLMDISMPVMNGLDAADKILASFSTCVVMLTALSDESFQSRAAQIGASGYLVKPISSAMLIPKLQEAYRSFLQKGME